MNLNLNLNMNLNESSCSNLNIIIFDQQLLKTASKLNECDNSLTIEPILNYTGYLRVNSGILNLAYT